MKYIIIGALAITILLLACKEDNTPIDVEQIPTIIKVIIPDKWNMSSSSYYRIEVTAQDPQGLPNLAGIYFEVLEANKESIIFVDSLYDDGAYFHPNDGDVIAGDGVFSNRFTANEIAPTDDINEYVFTFIALDREGHQSKEYERIVAFAPNYRPRILQVSVPDTFPWITTGIVFSITAADSDGIDDIVTAYFESQDVVTGANKFEADLFNDGDLAVHGDTTAGDSIFSVKLDSTFRVNKQGEYDLIFQVEDSYGAKNTYIPNPRIFVGNTGAKFLSINVPSYMARPLTPGDYNRELMTVEVSDPQGLADIDSVYFYSLKPDSSWANLGKPFLLVDDGRPFNESNPDPETGDLVANDGIYSFSIIVYNNPQTNLGTYTFYIYIRDKAENLTGPEVRQITIIPD
jgi:hypothetical protein